jgi:hypothetical protein
LQRSIDAGLELVKDRPDREVALQVLERLLDRKQQFAAVGGRQVHVDHLSRRGVIRQS